MTVHIFPPDDWIEHHIRSDASECNCPCKPRIIFIDQTTGLPFSEPIVIHNAIESSLNWPDFRWISTAELSGPDD